VNIYPLLMIARWTGIKIRYIRDKSSFNAQMITFLRKKTL